MRRWFMRKLEELLTEHDLAEKFGLAVKIENGMVTGKSRVLSSWIRKGLRCVEVSGRRFFREEDIVGFFNNLFDGAKDGEVDE